jgi:hypothetical protein
VSFGSAVGRKPAFIVESDRHGTNLFTVIVGDTAKARKGTSWGRIRSIFEEIDPAWTGRCIKSGLSSGEGLLFHVRDRIEENGQLVDKGIEDKRLLITEKEFASVLKVLKRDGNTLSPVMREAWDGTNLSSLVKNFPNTSTSPHISVVGHITVDELRRNLGDTEVGNGFGNRFLWVYAKRSKLLPEGGDQNFVSLTMRVKQTQEAIEFASKTSVLRFDESARNLWHKEYSTLSHAKPGLVGVLTARAEAQVVRLSCIYALLDKSFLIRIHHLQAALAVWHYCEESCRFIFGSRIGNSTADDILIALRRCAEGGGLTRTEISGLFQRHRSSNQINNALSTLAELGLARPMQQSSSGRPSERWIAVPANAKEAKNAN